MSAKDDEFLKRLRSAFRAEAADHLQTISASLMEMEAAPAGGRRQKIVSTIFRESHSLKGAARAVNAADVEAICQSMESVFAAWKQGDRELPPDAFDVVHQAVSAMGQLVAADEEGRTGGAGGNHAAANVVDTSSVLSRLARLSSDGSLVRPVGGERAEVVDGPVPTGETSARETPTSVVPQAAVPTASEPASSGTKPPAPAATSPSHQAGGGERVRAPSVTWSAGADTLRISVAKLDALLLRAEEMLSVKLTANQRAGELRTAVETLDLWAKEWANVSSETWVVRQRIDAAGESSRAGRGDGATVADLPGHAAVASASLIEFLEWNEGFVRSLAARLRGLVGSADHDRRAAGAMVDALLEDAKRLLMLPFHALFEAFPKLVRDLSRDQGKPVNLVVHGGDVEIDKRILEEMKDPLIHLLRNAVDHGIEPPARRAAAGKPPAGTITLAVSQVDGNKVEIRVSDDGGGVDRARVTEAAARKGVLDGDQARDVSERDALSLIFQAEVSTSPVLTEISGRGLGLSIVQEKVERLGGQVVVESAPGAGTTFRLLLPLTLATFRGILVAAGDQVFVIPTAAVERVARLRPEDVRTLENRETIRVDGRAVALARLDDVLELPRRRDAAAGAGGPAFVTVVVVGAGEQRIAFRVDAVLNEQEVLVKRLGKPLVRVRNIAGATVLGSGKPVPILNVADLMKSAVRQSARPAAGPGSIAATAPGAAAADRRRGSILVAEDSITARMLVKSILESAGYDVTTAVDGADALTALKVGEFDLVVSDVEMPRLNGFELTSRIRADRRLANLPVVLVTALASREDRERGADAGANAYIVKSSFDQSNLLEAVERLL